MLLAFGGLRFWGVKDVRLLNGGWKTWAAMECRQPLVQRQLPGRSYSGPTQSPND